MWARTNDGPGVASRDSRRFAVPLLPLAAALIIPACFHAPPTAPATATSVELVSGSGQSGTPGYRLDNEVTVRVRDDAGHPIAGVVVTFSPDDQFAYAEPGTDTTDQDGVARTAWRLGGLLGEQHLRAGIAGTAVESASAAATASSANVRSISGDYNGWCMVSMSSVLTCTVPPALDAPNPAFPGTVVAPGTAFTEVTTHYVAGQFNAYGGCAVTTAGRIWCFDRAADGSITNSTELSGSYPPLHGLVSTAVAYVTPAMCALAADGAGFCWGSNFRGILGVGDQLDRSTPTPLATTQRFASIVLDSGNGCGLTADGAAYCWGLNVYGESGVAPGSGFVLAPTPVMTTERFRQLGFIGYYDASCGIRITGGLVCWGGYPGLFGMNAGFGVIPAAAPGGQAAMGVHSFGRLTVLLMQDGSLSMIGRPYTDIWAGYPYPVSAASDGFLRELGPGYSESLLCGPARGGSGVLCQTKLRMAYDRSGQPAPGVSGSLENIRYPAVIGIPVR